MFNRLNNLQRRSRSYTSLLNHSKATYVKDVFVDAAQAEFLAAAASPSSIPKLNGLPEVIVAGRANVGKSTLLNAVLGRRDLLNVSKKAGRTQTLNFYRVGRIPGRLVVVDSPGYGARGRPEWGEVWDHYITTRDQLRRIYILINASHGVTEYDKMMFEHLDRKLGPKLGTSITLQAVLTKIDKLPHKTAAADLAAVQKSLFEAAPYCLPPILTTLYRSIKIGVEPMRQSISEACYTH